MGNVFVTWWPDVAIVVAILAVTVAGWALHGSDELPRHHPEPEEMERDQLRLRRAKNDNERHMGAR